MDFWHSMGGMVQVQITSADPEFVLTKLNQKGITLHNLNFLDELTCTFAVMRKDYKSAKQLCSNLDISLNFKGKYGIYWVAKRLLHRPVLLVGIALLTALVMLLPTRVLFFRVEGNDTVPERRILEAAENCGIRFGASRREVRSEKVKNALIGAVPELQWAGINTKGCVATISVKERAAVPQSNAKPAISSIVAERDGFILRATATKGMLLVQPGQSVSAGQTLISGINDLGLLVQTTAAEGEVYAQTQRELTMVTPDTWHNQHGTGQIRKNISLLIGKKRINLWKDSGISGATCGRMYKEMCVTLPGNFVLPVALCVESFEVCEWEEKTLEEITENSGMFAYSEQYLHQQMIAGEILHSQQQLLYGEGVCLLKESFVCREMIGRQRQEQIGDIHE